MTGKSEENYRGYADSNGIKEEEEDDSADDVPDSITLASGHCPLDKCQQC